MTDFSSTDDIRSDSPLQHLQQVAFPGPISLELGGELPEIVCAYETWAALNADASNAVLICHAISGDSHAARHDSGDEPGWWEDLIGPGKHVDTDRYFVVCPNILGGCRGTTGPSDLDPDADPPAPFGASFPAVTVGDMVEVQRRLAGHLGIRRWRAIVGGSLGGHQALTWAARHPSSADLCVAIASSARLTAQAIGFDVIARNAIQTDPHFAGGQYYGRPESPDTGLAIARMLGHVTYLSSKAMDNKFDQDRHDPRDVASAFEQRFSVGSYLAYQGQKFTSRFDANSYVTLSMAMDLFDLGGQREQLMEQFAGADCDFLVVSFSSDWLFTPQQSRDIVNALTAQGKSVTYAEITTAAGHDSFLISDDIAQYGPLISAKLGGPLAGQDRPPASPSRPRPAGAELLESEVVRLIPPEASVLDLGCGIGDLLSALRRRGQRRLVGVEVAQSEIAAAVARGHDVIDYDLNQGLPSFTDDQFDIVVLNHTLQVVENIDGLFDEMLRVGRSVVISFANFAYRELREDYVRRGRSPRTPGAYDFSWYDTPNRRFPSIADVLDLCAAKGAEVHDAVYLDCQRGGRIDDGADPNLEADTAVLRIGRAQ